VHFASGSSGAGGRVGGVVVGAFVTLVFLWFAAQSVRVKATGLVLQNRYRLPEFHPYTQIRRIILKRRGYLVVAQVELETGELRSARAITYPGAWMSLERVKELIRELNDVVERAKAEPDATLR
jgi:hypothetical protein